MSVFRLTRDGRITKCIAKPENLGKPPCDHIKGTESIKQTKEKVNGVDIQCFEASVTSASEWKASAKQLVSRLRKTKNKKTKKQIVSDFEKLLKA